VSLLAMVLWERQGVYIRAVSPDPATNEWFKQTCLLISYTTNAFPVCPALTFLLPPAHIPIPRVNTSQQASIYSFAWVSIQLDASPTQFLITIRPTSWWMARQFRSDFGILLAKRIMIVFDRCPILKPMSSLSAFLS
jgi:hypothetical protein